MTMPPGQEPDRIGFAMMAKLLEEEDRRKEQEEKERRKREYAGLHWLVEHFDTGRKRSDKLFAPLEPSVLLEPIESSAFSGFRSELLRLEARRQAALEPPREIVREKIVYKTLPNPSAQPFDHLAAAENVAQHPEDYAAKAGPSYQLDGWE